MTVSVGALACATAGAPTAPTQAAPVALRDGVPAADSAPQPLDAPLAGTLADPAFATPPGAAVVWRSDAPIRVAPVWSGHRVVVSAIDGTLHGVDSGSTDASTPSNAWTLQLQTPVVGLATDGRGNLRTTSRDGDVIALSDSGERLWTTQLGASADSACALGDDGRTYALADGLHALDAQGRLLWHLPRVGASRAGPTIIGELIVFGTQHGDLVAVDAGGRPRFEVHVGATVDSPPTAGPQDDILVGNDLGEVLSFAADGSLRWRAQLEGRVESTPSVGADGRIGVLADGGTLHILDRGGTLLWTFRVGGGAFERPTLDPTGAVLLAGRDNTLYLIDPSGQPRWRANVGRPVSTPIIATPGGRLYMGTDDGHLLTLQKRNPH